MVVRKRIDASIPGLMFITTTIRDWQPVFNDDQAAQIALKQFGETAEQKNVGIVGYVLMPSHLHALIGMRDIGKLSILMQAYKSLSSRRIKEANLPCLESPCFYVNNHFSLWKRGFDDLAVFSHRQFEIKLEYIHNNPVKARLVGRSIDYRYSSARDWLSGGEGLIRIDKDFSWLEH